MPLNNYFFLAHTPKNIRISVKIFSYGWLVFWAIALIFLAFSSYIPALCCFGGGLFSLIIGRIISHVAYTKGLMGNNKKKRTPIH